MARFPTVVSKPTDFLKDELTWLLWFVFNADLGAGLLERDLDCDLTLKDLFVLNTECYSLDPYMIGFSSFFYWRSRANNSRIIS